MKKTLRIFAALAAVAGSVACASVEKMAKMAENIQIQCTPEVMEAIGGNVDVQVAVTYPKE